MRQHLVRAAKRKALKAFLGEIRTRADEGAAREFSQEEGIEGVSG